MRLDDFDFELPSLLIADRPAEPRDAARLLIVRPRAASELAQALVRDLPCFLDAGDVLAVNDTKVLQAQLSGIRHARLDGGPEVPVSLTCIEPLGDGRWRVLARPARRLRAGDRIAIGGANGGAAVDILSDPKDGEAIAGPAAGGMLEDIMAAQGALPLPPYMGRAADIRDNADYQTVFAAAEGAVAAPTAGLHFTPALLDGLRAAGVRLARLTLHVGAGTFLPVKSGRIEDHTMHAERCELSSAAARTINDAKASGKRVIAVGTTVMRLLETAALPDGTVAPFSGKTEIFIKPGHRFRIADLMLTNFHLPKSTLFMLVCAFSGTVAMKRAYAHAIASGFRFYSYGDACLLYPGWSAPSP